MANTTQSFNAFAKFGELFFDRQAPVLGAKTHTGVFTSLAQSFNAWRSRRIAAAELSNLTDRELADIGVTRQEIPEVVGRRA